MSDYDDYEDDWDMDDMWWEDVECLADLLVTTAWGHEPPYNPDTYDTYDSDLEEPYDDGDDEYFDGPLPDPDPDMSVPSSPPRHISQPNTPTPAWLLESEKRYRDAMVGKRFYGEEDESVVQVVRIYPVPVGTVGKVRKRRKVGVNGVSVRVLGDEGEHVSGEVGENEDPSSITKRSTHYNGNGVVVEKEEGYHSEEDVEKVEGRDMVVEEDGTEQASLRARIKGVDIRGGVVSGEGNGVKADIGGSTTAPVVRRRGDKSHEQKMNAQTKTKTQKSSTTSHESFLSPEDLTRRNRKRKSTPPQD